LSVEHRPQGDQSASRHTALKHTTTIDGGMTRTSVGRERPHADTTYRSHGPRLSAEELRRARDYLARPDAQMLQTFRKMRRRYSGSSTKNRRASVAIAKRSDALFGDVIGAQQAS
jgi:hypothetical protein